MILTQDEKARQMVEAFRPLAEMCISDPDAPLVALVHGLAGGQTLAEMVRKARFRRKRAGASEEPASTSNDQAHPLDTDNDKRP